MDNLDQYRTVIAGAFHHALRRRQAVEQPLDEFTSRRMTRRVIDAEEGDLTPTHAAEVLL